MLTAGHDVGKEQRVVVDVDRAQQFAFEPGQAMTQSRNPSASEELWRGVVLDTTTEMPGTGLLRFVEDAYAKAMIAGQQAASGARPQ